MSPTQKKIEKMEDPKRNTDIGIIVGRFQTNELHVAHKALINSVMERSARTIIFLGVSPLRNTSKNPLDFKHRAAMIRDTFPECEVYSIEDHRSNEEWSTILDRQITNLICPGQSIRLYGSRDSFINSYTGRFETCELTSDVIISASQVRHEIKVNYPSSKDFRAGLIAATGYRYPTSFQAVDCAIIDWRNHRVLMAKKPREDKYRFVGGFSDPRSASLEEDAIREVKEETGVDVGELVYIGSTRVKDWRFRGEQDCIKTVLFAGMYTGGDPEAADDIELVKWFPLNLNKTEIVEEHHELVDMFNVWHAFHRTQFSQEHP